MIPEEFIKFYIEKAKQDAIRYIEQTNRYDYIEEDIKICRALNYDNIQLFLSLNQMQCLTSEEKQKLYDYINNSLSKHNN